MAARISAGSLIKLICQRRIIRPVLHVVALHLRSPRACGNVSLRRQETRLSVKPHHRRHPRSDRPGSARTSRPITILGAAPWRADLGGHAETPGVGGISDVSDLAWGAVTGICAWVSPATPAMLWALCLAGRRPNRRAVDPAPRERGTGYPGNPSSESNSELSSAGGWRRTRRPYAPPAGLASSCWQPTVFPPRPISAIVSLHESNVAKWRNRFREKGLEGQRRSAKWPTSSLRLYEGIGPAPV
jgi:hypothetical protein